MYKDINKATQDISEFAQAQKMSTGMISEAETPANYFFGNAAHEYYAHYVQSAQSLIHFSPFDILPGNFGTIDNPALIFSNGMPYKYVACTGHFDDHCNYHAPIWFKLQEGPMSRCYACGQVFKLINIKDTDNMKYEKYTNIMNDYHMKHFRSDSNFGTNLGRSHNKSFLPSNMDAATPFLMTEEQNDVYRKDYEFRLAVTHEREQKYPQFVQNMQQFQREVDDILGLAKWETHENRLTTDDYLSEVENETELLRLERSIKRINKFARRDIEGDLTQYPRREQRMLERAVKRKAGGVSHQFYTEAELQYFDFFESDEEFNHDSLDDAYTKEIVQQVVDSYQPVLSDRNSPADRLIEYYTRRHFLASNNATRENQMLAGILSRKAAVDEATLLGDTEKLKGVEFVNRVKDYYYDDEVVQSLVSKVKEEDYFRMAYMFEYVPLGTNHYQSQFEWTQGKYSGWNIYDAQDNVLFYYDDDLSYVQNVRDWFNAKFLNIYNREKLDMKDFSYVQRTHGKLQDHISPEGVVSDTFYSKVFDRPITSTLFEQVTIEKDPNTKEKLE